jgi:hypothetical protein
MKFALNSNQSHDVVDRKGVSLKRRKQDHLFSIEYGRRNDESCAAFYVEATISMVEKSLMANLQLAAILYVIENKARSKLACKSDSFRSHDVYGRKGVTGKARLRAISYVVENKSRSGLALRTHSF